MREKSRWQGGGLESENESPRDDVLKVDASLLKAK